MTCQGCNTECQRFGKHRNGLRRFRCPKCHRTFTESHQRTLGTMYISAGKAALAIRLLIEGNSIRSTVLMTGVAKNTVAKLIADLGRALG